LGTSGLSGSDSFFAAGGDSLKAVAFALDLSEQLEQEIETTLVSNTETFGDLTRAIETGAAATSFAARLIRDGDPASASVFTINDRRRYEILAPQLQSTYRVWNLDVFGIPKNDLSSLSGFTLEELAEVFAGSVLAVDPKGPWNLVVFCKSACLAIETARVLQRRSGQACKLTLIDAFFGEYIATPWVHAKRLFDFGPGYYFKKVAHRFGLSRWKADAEDVPIEQHIAVMEMSGDDKTMRDRFNQLCMTYDIAPYDGPLTLVASREFRHNSRVSSMKLAAQGLEVVIVDGLHLNLFQPKPNKRGLAQAIDAEVLGHRA